MISKGLIVAGVAGVAGLLLFASSAQAKPAAPKLGTIITLRDSTDKSVKLRFQQAGAGHGFVPIEFDKSGQVDEVKGRFSPNARVEMFGRKWDWFEGLNAFVEASDA